MKYRKFGKNKHAVTFSALTFISAAIICGFANQTPVQVSASDTACSVSEHQHQFSVDGSTFTFSALGTNKTISSSCGANTFINSNSSINKVVVAEGIETISNYSFNGISNLTSIEIASSVNDIGGYAFGNCYLLSNIEFKGNTVPNLFNGLFMFTSSKGTITVPIGKLQDYQDAFAALSNPGMIFDENHWSIVEYSDAPKFNDGFENKNLTSTSYVIGNEYTVHDDVKYSFAGWYQDQTYAGNPITEFLNNTTYYAKWNNSFGNTVVVNSMNFKKTPASTIPDGSGISWDSVNKKISLSNVTIDTKEQVGLNLPADSTITVSGENTIRAIGNGDINYKKCVGIYSDQAGSLTIDGNGSLKAYGGNLVEDAYAYTSNAARLSAGIYVNGNLSISDINLYSESGKTDCEESGSKYYCGLSNGILSTSKISIDNATVTAVGGDGSVTDNNGFSIGIHSYNNLEITNSIVNASSGYALQDSDAIFAGWSVNTSATITAYGPNDIFLANIIVDDSTVTAISGTTKNYDTIGIYAHNNISFKDSTIVAKNSGPKGTETEHGETRASGIFHNEDLVIDNSNVIVEAYGTGIYTYTHADEIDEGKTAIFGRTDIKNNSNVSIKTLDDGGAAFTACNRLLIDNSSLKCSVNTPGTVAAVFNDPNHAASTIDGLTINGSGKIISNGTFKVEETDSANPYYFGNTTDKHYYVSNSATQYLDGTGNVVSPNTGSEMNIGIAYTVTYNANGHGTAPSNQIVFSGDLITKPVDPTCEGYSFFGWYKDSACTEAWNFDTDKVNDNLTLYAKWLQVFTVTFNVNGHGTAPSTQQIISGNNVAKPADPTCEGYSFSGWYKDIECTEAWNFDTDAVTENVTLYAKWANVLVSNLWWIILLSVLVLLLIIYICGYFALYRQGKLDEHKIKVIYKILPRGNKNKELE